MHATIYDNNDKPLTGDIEIDSDYKFETLETKARQFAASGKKCCIKWIRESDGQSAYWGPSGATLHPHWYQSPGRPKKMTGGKVVNVYLDQSSIDNAARLGYGNVSEGIRSALKLVDIV